MAFVRSGAARLAYEAHGTGPPVIFLHAGVADRRMWQDQLTAIGATHRVIAYDRRGFGETRYSVEDHSHVADLLAVMDALTDSAPAVLVGCSQGGSIALDAALAHPDRVRALVLIAPAVSGAPAPDYPPDIQAHVDAVETAEEVGDLDRVNAREAHLWLDGPRSAPGRVGGAARELFLDMNGTALTADPVGAAHEPPSAYDRLGEIRVPILVLWGDLDFPHIAARCEHLAREIPDAGAEVMPGTAHLPSLERPAELSARLATFLDGL